MWLAMMSRTLSRSQAGSVIRSSLDCTVTLRGDLKLNISPVRHAVPMATAWRLYISAMFFAIAVP
ncbi:protein of unknown function [Candidatus Methylocalor cossyra]|uniref:Uncharacterized protein n=1 Tax=Candidatus Methylocalor cossyra TaxID=3108543 RepID=A0ABM9NEQ8_9GAMM